MPLSAREIMIIVSAQNRASRALRSVAGDLRSLSALEANRLKQQRLSDRLAQVSAGGRRHTAAIEQQAKAIRSASVAQGIMAQKTRSLIDLQRQYDKAIASGKLKEQSKGAQTVRRRMDDLTTSIRRQSNALQNAAVTHAAGTARLRDMGKEAAVMRGQMRGLQKENKQIKWTNFERGARSIRDASRGLGIMSAVGAAAFGVTAKMAADFSTSMSLVATQTGKAGESITKTQKNAKKLEQAVLPMLQEFPASAQEMSDSMFEFFSSTTQGKKGAIDLASGVKLLRLANKAAVAGQSTLAESTDAIVTTMNNFGISVDHMPGALQTMFAAVRFGRMRFSEFSESIKTFAPAAKAANQSLEETAGTFAFLTTRLGPAMGRTGLMRLLEIFQRKDFVDGLKEMGVAAVDSAGNLKPMSQLIPILVKQFPKLKKGGVELSNFFKTVTAATGGRGMTGTAQARRAFFALITGAKEFQKTVQNVKDDNNEFTKSLRVMEQTPGVKLAVLLNTLKSMAITIGQSVLPVLQELTPWIQKATQWFNNLDKSTRTSIIKWGLIAAGIGLVVSALGLLSGSILGIVGLIGRLGLIAPAFLLISAAVLALTGHMSSLGDVVSTVMNLFTGSWQGLIAGAALAVAAVLKVRGAVLGMQTAIAVRGAGAGAAGGLVPMMFGSGASMRTAGATAVRTATNVTSAYKKAGVTFARTRGILKGAATGFLLLPGPIKLVAGAIAASAIAFGAWELHQRNMQIEAEKTARAVSLFVTSVAPGRVAANMFFRVNKDINDLATSRDQLEMINIQIRDMNKQIAAAPKGDQRRALEIQLNQLLRDKAVLLQNVRTGYANLVASSHAFSVAIQEEGRVTQVRKNAETALTNLMNKRRGIMRQIQEAGGMKTSQIVQPNLMSKLEDVNRAIQNTRNFIKGLGTEGSRNIQLVNAAWTRYIQRLKDAALLPRTFGASFSRMARQVSRDIGRALSPGELKKAMGAFEKIQMGVELKKGDLKGLGPAVQRALKAIQRQKFNVPVTVDLKSTERALRRNLPKLLSGQKLKPMKVPIKPEIKPADITKAFGRTGIKGFDPLKQLKPKKPVEIPVMAKVKLLRANVEGAFKTPVVVKINGRTGDLPSPAEIAGKIGDVSKPVNFTIGSVPSAAAVQSMMPTPVITARVVPQGPHQSGSPTPVELLNTTIYGLQAAADTTPVTIPATVAPAPTAVAAATAVASDLAEIEVQIFTGKILEKKREVEAAVIDVFAGGAIDKAIERAQQKLEKHADKIEESNKALAEKLRKQSERLPDTFIPSPKLMRRDLMVSIKQMEMFSKALNKLERRGAPVGLLNALRSMGPEHAKWMKRLSTATERELNKYIKAWRRAEKAQAATVQKLRPRDLINDLKSQTKEIEAWNKAMTRIAKRGVPPELIAGLRELGLDELQIIKVLATSTSKEMKQIIAWWKKLEAAKKKANAVAATTGISDEDKENIKQHLIDLYTSFAEEAGAAFGELFAGGVIEGINNRRDEIKSALEGVFGDIGSSGLLENTFSDPAELDRATAAYERQRRDILRQIAQLGKDTADAENDTANRRAEIMKDQAERIAEVNKRLAEDIVQAGIDAIDSKRQEMQSAFGALFAGAFLASEDVATRLEWGEVLNMDDLTRDLQSQLEAFRNWRRNLAIIAAKAPKEFVDELEALGPDAADKIELLANASDSELSNYVDLWRQKNDEIEDIALKAIADTTKLRADADKEIADIIADTQKSLTDLTSDVASGASQASQDVEDLMDQLADLNDQLFELDKNAPKALTFQTLIADLGKRVGDVKDFGSLLQQLAARGAPQELIDELAAMGKDAIPILRVLVSASDAEIANYISLWKEGQSAIELAMNGIQAAVDPDDLIADLHKQNEAFANWEGLLSQLAARDVPQELIDDLRRLGPDALPLLQALVSMTDTQLTAYVTEWTKKQDTISKTATKWMNDEIAKWYKFGKDIFTNWLKGAESIQPIILQTIQKMMDDWIKKIQGGTPAAGGGGGGTTPAPGGTVGTGTTYARVRDKDTGVVQDIAKNIWDAHPEFQGDYDFLQWVAYQRGGVVGNWPNKIGRQLFDFANKMPRSHSISNLAFQSRDDIPALLSAGELVLNQDQQLALAARFSWLQSQYAAALNAARTGHPLDDELMGEPIGPLFTPKPPFEKLGPPQLMLPRAPGGGGTIVYQTVYAVQDESLESTLRRATFEFEHTS
jgi:TP901 family phage tail tape measure protein